MKPRNEREREVMRLSAKLPQITKSQIGYAIEHCFDHRAAQRSAKHHTYYCLDCGETITASEESETIICPSCGHRLTTDGVRQKKKEVSSFQVITTTHGWQVVRTWYFERMTRRGQEATYEVYECVQRWMRPGEKDIIIALNKVFMPRYYDQFDRYSEMSIKYEGNAVTYYGNPYDIYAKAIYPRQSVLPVVNRNGYCQWLKKNTKFSDTFHRLLNHPEFETIAKMGRFDIWECVDNRKVANGFISERWPQIKMAMRHGYFPFDFKLWQDTLDMAEEFGYDIHSPKYVLPADLQQLHDRLMRRKNAAEREKEIEKHREDTDKFLKHYMKFLGICIEVGDITIRPLQNFEEFYDEGKAMHHCVAMYFGRAGSLILSARQGNRRLATIELDTKKFDVQQCRCVNNGHPERYDEIVSIINDHRKDFIKANRKRVA